MFTCFFNIKIGLDLKPKPIRKLNYFLRGISRYFMRYFMGSLKLTSHRILHYLWLFFFQWILPRGKCGLPRIAYIVIHYL